MLDNFPDVFRRLSAGMDRQAKINILVQFVDSGIVIDKLQSDYVVLVMPDVKHNNISPEGRMSKTLLSEQVWLIKASLLIAGISIAFFLCAPIIGYPIEYAHSFRMLEMIAPIFLGYLGSASVYIVSQDRSKRIVPLENFNPLLPWLVRGPVFLFAFSLVVTIFVFGWSNRSDAPSGVGISTNAFALILSAELSLLNVSTNIIVSYLFRLGSGK